LEQSKKERPRNGTIAFKVETCAGKHTHIVARLGVLGARTMIVNVKTSFACPNCNALYQVIRQQAGPETVNHEVTCRACGGPLPNREGKFILKYFLLRKSGRIQRWRKSPLSPRKVFFKTGE
jgi:predicted RNA-binding Zn-ribbon protein involved in translation (DUF1610 family)